MCARMQANVYWTTATNGVLDFMQSNAKDPTEENNHSFLQVNLIKRLTKKRRNKKMPT